MSNSRGGSDENDQDDTQNLTRRARNHNKAYEDSLDTEAGLGNYHKDTGNTSEVSFVLERKTEP